MPLTTPTINGLGYDFASIRLRANGYSLAEYITDISFKDEITPSMIEGAHPIALGSGPGRYKADGSITVRANVWYSYLSTLPDGYGFLVFPISITYQNFGANAGPLSTAELRECRFLGEDESYAKNNTDGLLVKVNLFVRYILRNGRCKVPLVLP